MSEGINVRKDDILWRFYCKRFTVMGKEVEAPENLCRYFWASVNGFGLWLDREVRLRSLWLIGLVATAMLFGVSRVPDTSNIVAHILVVTVVVVSCFAFMLASLVTLIRAKRVVETRAPWVKYLLGFCFIVFAVVYMITPETFGSEFQQLFGYMFRWMGYYMLIVMVPMIIITLVISTIPHRPVNPSEEFKVKP